MWNQAETGTGSEPQQMPRQDAEDLGVGIQGAATAQASCDARLVELVDRFDAGTGWAWYDGISSCAHWLAWACSMGPGTAREHIRVARALRSMPQTAAMFADGSLTYSKVRELTRLADRVDEAELCRLALEQTASQLARTVRAYRAHSGTHLPQTEKRQLSWRETDDGMVSLSVRLLPEEAAMVRGAIEAATDRQLDEPEAESVPDDKERPQTDPVAGLCQVARGFLDSVPATSTDDPHLVVVHVGIETLTETQPGPASAPGGDVPAGTSGDELRAGQAWIERGGPIEPATAVRLTCDAQVVGMIHDRNGDVLAMGRSRRLASPSQRRALRVRDGSCQFPGCTRHRRLKAHHIIHWADGGRTDLDNMVLLCQRHHTYVHEGQVRLTGHPGAWLFTLPDGHTISTGDDPDPEDIDRAVMSAARAAAEQPQQIFPPRAGEGFRLHDCVERLFDIELPGLPDAA